MRSWSQHAIESRRTKWTSWNIDLSEAFLNAVNYHEIYFNIRQILLSKSTSLFNANVDYMNDFVKTYNDAMIQCDRHDHNRAQQLYVGVQNELSIIFGEIIRDIMIETSSILRSRMIQHSDIFSSRLQFHLEQNARLCYEKLNLTPPAPVKDVHESETVFVQDPQSTMLPQSMFDLTISEDDMATTKSSYQNCIPGSLSGSIPIEKDSEFEAIPINVLKRTVLQETMQSEHHNTTVASSANRPSCQSSITEDRAILTAANSAADFENIAQKDASDDTDSPSLVMFGTFEAQSNEIESSSSTNQETSSSTGELILDQNQITLSFHNEDEDSSQVHPTSTEPDRNVTNDAILTGPDNNPVNFPSLSDHHDVLHRGDECGPEATSLPISSAKKSGKKNPRKLTKPAQHEQANGADGDRCNEFERHSSMTACSEDVIAGEVRSNNPATNLNIPPSAVLSPCTRSSLLPKKAAALKFRIEGRLFCLTLDLQDDPRFQSEDCDPSLLYSSIENHITEILEKTIYSFLRHDYDCIFLSMLSVVRHLEKLHDNDERLPSLAQVERKLTALHDIGIASIDNNFIVICELLHTPLSQAIYQGVLHTKLKHVLSTTEYVTKVLSVISGNGWINRMYEDLPQRIAGLFETSLEFLRSLPFEFPSEDLSDAEFNRQVSTHIVCGIELQCTARVSKSLMSLPDEFSDRFEAFYRSSLAKLTKSSSNKSDDRLVDAILLESRQLLLLSLKEIKQRTLRILNDFLAQKSNELSCHMFSDEMRAVWICSSIQNALQDIAFAFVGRLHLIRCTLVRKVQVRNALIRKDSRRKFDGNRFHGSFHDEFLHAKQFCQRIDDIIEARKVVFQKKLQKGI